MKNERPSQHISNSKKFNLGINKLLMKWLYHSGWRILPQSLAIISGLVGIAAFIGWVCAIPLLKSIFPNAIEMKANTAIGIIMASVALYIHSTATQNRLYKFLSNFFAGVVLFIGSSNFCQYLFGWNLKIDELLFKDTSKTFTSAPGRLAFLTSVSFILIGMTLIFLATKRLKVQTRIMTIPIIAIGTTVLFGYVWHANELVTSHWSTPVAVNTAFSITLLGIGLFFTSFAHLKFSFTQIEKKILLGFIGAFTLVALGAGLTYKKSTEYADSVKWVIHTQQVLTELNQLYNSVLDAESTQRSYLLTKIKSNKDDYAKANIELNQHKQKTMGLLVDNPAQIKNIEKLIWLIEQRIQKLDQHITIFENQGEANAIVAITTDDGLILMQQIRTLIKVMSDIEAGLLSERERSLIRNQENTLLSLLGTLILSVIILATLYVGIRKEMEARTNAERLLQQAKDKAEHANRAKDSFLAIMSHEIRTPLTGMLGMLELLSMTPMEEEQSTTLDAAWDSGRGLLRIVSDILDWSKIEEGKLELSPRPTSISQLLKDVVNTYSKVASSKSLILWQHSDSRLSSTHIVDSLRLSQVLNNFVSNAIKFTKRGEIEIRAELRETRENGERIQFSVKDTGIGIAKDTQAKLFQNYRQESADTARMYGGTGLGLAICRRLSELMDGEINMESEINRGSTFSITLTLPVSSLPAETIVRSRLDIAQRTIKPLFEEGANAPLILAVDDHPTNRDLLARQIKLLGLRVETAENGKLALPLWQEKRFSLIITDCHMPEMDGYALSQMVRKIESEFNLPRTPIIGWTANALPEEEKHCNEAGMDDLLIKPTDMGQLKRKLAKWLALIPQEGIETKTVSSNIETNLSKPIDYSVFNKIVQDKSRQIQILLYFQSHIRTDQLHLMEMLQTGDLNNIENTAHRMKGSSLMLGAKSLGNILEIIEQTAHDRNLEGARAEIPKLNKAIKEIEEHCSTLGTYDGKGLGGLSYGNQ